MTMGRTITRRTALRGLGTTVALPLLDAMSPLTAKAATSPVPRRAAFVYVPNGVIQQNWFVNDTGPLPAELPRILKPLEPLKNDLLVLSGLTLDKARSNGDGGGDHARAMAAFLTGSQPRKTSGADIKVGMSADQQLATVLGKRTKFPSLEIGIERGRQAGSCDSGYSCAYSCNMSWRSANTPNAKEIDPKLVFDRLFGDGGEREAAESRAKREEYSQSILDFVMDDAKQLQKQLGRADRQKVDEYLTGVRELERRIEQDRANRGKPLPKPTMERPEGIPRDSGEHIRLMCDLTVLAFQADLTRVVTFPFADEGSNRSYPQVGVRDGHHQLSHHRRNESKMESLTKINTFHIEQFAYLLNKLRSVKEAEGNLLDQSLIVYGSGNGDGDRHTHHDLPILLAGHGGCDVLGGRHIRYPRETPLMNLYMKMFEMYGAPAERFGDSTGVVSL